MLTESSTQSNKFEISSIQRILFNVLLFVLPWFIIPLPWDFTERGKSLLIAGIATVLVVLEVVKWIWNGKITILRSPLDGILLVLFSSALLSFLFARDSWIAMWGFDGRLSSGLFTTFFLFGIFYLCRDFISSKEKLFRSIESLLWGTSLLAFLSLLSFFRVDVFSAIPIYRDFITVGLPLTFSFTSMVIVSGTSIFLLIFLLFNSFKNKEYVRVSYLVMMLLLNILSFVIFSISQSVLIPVIFCLAIIFLAVLFFFKTTKDERYIPVSLVITSLVILLLSIAFQMSSFRNAVLGSEFELLTPLRLNNSISWQVSTSALTSDLSRGLFGLGNDSFSVAYSYYKPLSTEILSLGNISFSNASNEALTVLANRGIVGLLAWILVGLALIRMLIKDIEGLKEKDSLMYLIPEVLAVALFFVSFVAPFNILSTFLFFFALLVAVVSRTLEKVNKEHFIVKFWAMDVGDLGKNLNQGMKSINWFLTVVAIVVGSFLVIKVLTLTVSSLYMLKAESYSIQQNKVYAESNPTLEEREQFVSNFLFYYDKAMSFDSRNALINRKAGLISLEALNLLSERYSEASDEEKKGILSNVSVWKNMAIEFSREAVQTSPYTYANWNARSTIYVGLIGIGLSDYTQDAVTSLQRGIELNPSDYLSYYQIGQVYMVNEEYENSLGAFNRALSINGQHVPSLVFAAQILSQQEDTKTAISYLDAAKTILEANNQEETDLYKNVTETLSELGGNTQESSSEEETTTKETE